MKHRANIKKATFHIVLASLFVATMTITSPTEAQVDGPVVLSGCGTATIDGVLSPAEWNNAASFDFQADLPLRDGGGTTPATLFVMNDGTNLYFGVKVVRDRLNQGDLGFGLDQVALEFDNDHDGGPAEDGDDVLLLSPGLNFSGLSAFFDEVRTTRPPCPPDIGLCGLLDVQLSVPGTNDGAGGATNNGVFSFFEISHPLDSADDLNDFSLIPGSTVGFFLLVNLSSVIPFCTSGCSAGTPSPLPGPGGSADITILACAGITVALDIMPGSDRNSIIPNGGGSIPVAILSSSTFDAFASVDTTSLTFGRTGNENSLAFCNRSRGDVNGDGLRDLLCHFDSEKAGFETGDTTAKLKGLTVSGTPIQGMDSVRIVP